MAIYYTRRTRGSDLGAVPRSVPTARTARTQILSLRSGAPLHACAARTRVHIGVCLALIAVTLRWARVGHRHACRMSQHLGLLFARAHGPCAPTTGTSLLHAYHPPLCCSLQVVLPRGDIFRLLTRRISQEHGGHQEVLPPRVEVATAAIHSLCVRARASCKRLETPSDECNTRLAID